MLLNDLASLARGMGLTVHEAPGWVGHNHGAMNSVSCIVIHHTAGSPTGDYPSYNVVRNGRTGLPGPLAQLGVGRSGKVYVFSNGLAYHAGTVKETWMNNANSIGIEVESVGTGPEWPSVQVHATAKLVAALCKRYGVPVSRVLGHKEVCYPVGRKIDPVGIPGDMPAFRSLVQQYLSGTVQEDNDMQPTDVVRDPGPDKWGWVWLNAQQNAKAVRAMVASLQGQVSALLTAVQSLAADGEVDLDAVRQAAEEGTAKALRENTVNVDIDIAGYPQV
jgi:hypothetical protein